MTKEELEKYAHENRKRLDAQKVKIGDVVKVLRGQFAGETGVVVGIIACGNDYADPYYEVDMDCDVPEKYKCRKSFISPNNVIRGLSAYEFEVIGNRAPMQSTEEIKVGDKVRVSKDAPGIYMKTIFPNLVSSNMEVTEIGYGFARIKPLICECEYLTFEFAIPTKYLTKVEDEAKEPRFKVGDVVRIKPDADKLHQGYQNGYAWLSERDNYLGCVASVKKIWCDGSIILNIQDNLLWEPIDLEPYTEPTELVQPKEQTEKDARIRQMEAELDEFRKAELDRVLHPEKYHTYAVTIDNVAVDWQRYEADLAKEIALKVANKYNDPKEAADYAVSVAKAVVENLKKK